MISLMYGKEAKRFRCKADELRRNLADGYIFFDYMSIPQTSVEDQQRAIASLVSYVSDSTYFSNSRARGLTRWLAPRRAGHGPTALVPHGADRQHALTLVQADGGRALAQLLEALPSPVACCAVSGYTMRSSVEAPPSVPDDRLKLAPHLKHLIAAREAQAASEGDLELFRVLHARTATLLDGTAHLAR